MLAYTGATPDLSALSNEAFKRAQIGEINSMPARIRVGNVIVVGMPWNYEKFHDEQTRLEAA